MISSHILYGLTHSFLTVVGEIKIRLNTLLRLGILDANAKNPFPKYVLFSALASTRYHHAMIYHVTRKSSRNRLRSIRSRRNLGRRYEYVDELTAEMWLMARNAMAFNDSGTIYYDNEEELLALITGESRPSRSVSLELPKTHLLIGDVINFCDCTDALE